MRTESTASVGEWGFLQLLGDAYGMPGHPLGVLLIMIAVSIALIVVAAFIHDAFEQYLKHCLEMRKQLHKDEIEQLKAEVKSIKSLVGIKSLGQA